MSPEGKNFEVPNNPDLREEELSPEALDIIMEKIRDINEEDTAFTLISKDYPTAIQENGETKLKNILSQGLIGTREEQSGIDRRKFFNPVDKETYIDMINRGLRPEVFFNIIGRSNYSGGHYPNIRQMIHGGFFEPNAEPMGIIFNLASAYKETYVEKRGDSLKAFTYAPNEDGLPYRKNGSPSLYKNKKGHFIGFSDTGFKLSPRVAPRNFMGVIFCMIREITDENEYKAKIERMIKERKIEAGRGFSQKDREQYKYSEETRSQILVKRAKQIAEEMISSYSDRPALLIPIYDFNGNLFWPKQMSYEEVKEFVKKREEKKAGK